ncbi:hypothetical protein A2U01_0076110 [Trifolium medium]|uniref:Uncharacterized protein n=1 Tax=Trifolium medium TaxID=97028 RepID=A0A392T3Z5_9FABA|nr:hypothetical protein [Trifolium medium]
MFIQTQKNLNKHGKKEGKEVVEKGKQEIVDEQEIAVAKGKQEIVAKEERLQEEVVEKVDDTKRKEVAAKGKEEMVVGKFWDFV